MTGTGPPRLAGDASFDREQAAATTHTTITTTMARSSNTRIVQQLPCRRVAGAERVVVPR
jgi:hypothetical protein